MSAIVNEILTIAASPMWSTCDCKKRQRHLIVCAKVSTLFSTKFVLILHHLEFLECNLVP